MSEKVSIIAEGAEWPPRWSEACSKGGSGQCDGFREDDNEWCGCPCHDDPDLPQTIAEVKVWHDELHREV